MIQLCLQLEQVSRSAKQELGSLATAASPSAVPQILLPPCHPQSGSEEVQEGSAAKASLTNTHLRLEILPESMSGRHHLPGAGAGPWAGWGLSVDSGSLVLGFRQCRSCSAEMCLLVRQQAKFIQGVWSSSTCFLFSAGSPSLLSGSQTARDVATSKQTQQNRTQMERR